MDSIANALAFVNIKNVPIRKTLGRARVSALAVRTANLVDFSTPIPLAEPYATALRQTHAEKRPSVASDAACTARGHSLPLGSSCLHHHGAPRSRESCAVESFQDNLDKVDA